MLLRHKLKIGALLALLATTQWSCAQQCAQIKRGYESALESEARVIEDQPLGAGMPTHLGVALRYELVGEVARALLVRSLGEQLDLSQDISIGSGKNIPVKLDSDAINLGFEADASCATCFRITGDLGGVATLTIPVLGVKTIPLNGAFNLIAPIQFDAQPDGEVKVRLDMAQIAEQSGSFLSLDLNGLPEAIGRALKQPLTEELFKRFVGRLKPVELFSFRAPQFGIKGVKVFPSELKLIPAQRALFLGFTTNLPGVAAGAGLSADKAIAFGQGENIAVALQPSILSGVVSALMQQDVIPRRYTMQGQSSVQGPAHVTLNRVALGQSGGGGGGGAAAEREPIDVGFRAWNLFGGEQGGPCFWFDALVKGVVSLEDKRLKVDLSQIELVDASVAPGLIQALASWKKAEFLQKTRTLIETTLSEPNLTLPGGATLTLAPSSLARDQNTLALRSLVTISMP